MELSARAESSTRSAAVQQGAGTKGSPEAQGPSAGTNSDRVTWGRETKRRRSKPKARVFFATSSQSTSQGSSRTAWDRDESWNRDTKRCQSNRSGTVFLSPSEAARALKKYPATPPIQDSRSIPSSFFPRPKGLSGEIFSRSKGKIAPQGFTRPGGIRMEGQNGYASTGLDRSAAKSRVFWEFSRVSLRRIPSESTHSIRH